jgi:hypothetical protein
MLERSRHSIDLSDRRVRERKLAAEELTKLLRQQTSITRI